MQTSRINQHIPYSGTQSDLSSSASSTKKSKFKEDDNWFDKLSNSGEWKSLPPKDLETALNCKDIDELAAFAKKNNITHMKSINEKGEITIFNFTESPPSIGKANGYRPLVNDDIGRLRHQAFIYSVYEENFERYSAQDLKNLKSKFNQSSKLIMSKIERSQAKLEKIQKDIAKTKEALNDTDENSESKYDVGSLTSLADLKMRAEQIKKTEEKWRELIEFNYEKMEKIDALLNDKNKVG
jgi:chaperonin cofactor prefoldin